MGVMCPRWENKLLFYFLLCVVFTNFPQPKMIQSKIEKE